MRSSGSAEPRQRGTETMESVTSILQRMEKEPAQRNGRDTGLGGLLRQHSCFEGRRSQILGDAQIATIFGDTNMISGLPRDSFMKPDGIYGWYVSHWVVVCKQSQEVVSAIRDKVGDNAFNELLQAKDKIGNGNSPMTYMARIMGSGSKACTFDQISTGNRDTDEVISYGLKGPGPYKLKKQANAAGTFQIHPISWAVILHDNRLLSSLLELGDTPSISEAEEARLLLHREPPMYLTSEDYLLGRKEPPMSPEQTRPTWGPANILYSIDKRSENSGWAPLHIASLVNERRMIDMLVCAGAQGGITDTFGNTYKRYLEEHAHTRNTVPIRTPAAWTKGLN